MTYYVIAGSYFRRLCDVHQHTLTQKGWTVTQVVQAKPIGVCRHLMQQRGLAGPFDRTHADQTLTLEIWL